MQVECHELRRFEKIIGLGCTETSKKVAERIVDIVMPEYDGIFRLSIHKSQLYFQIKFVLPLNVKTVAVDSKAQIRA